MPLDLINIGAEANDGTGDTPRAAGQKINEAIAALNALELGAAPVQSVAGRTGAVTLTKADVGLASVDDTSDADKPISTDAQAALDLKLEAAAIASFETTAQLNARDTANRDRSNHTGTQPAATITGLAAVATSGQYGDLVGAPAPAIKAWINFDGTTTPPTIRASQNVSSVVRNGTGDFTVNLLTALADANYAVVATATGTASVVRTFDDGTARTASSFRVAVFQSQTGAAINPTHGQIIVVR